VEAEVAGEAILKSLRRVWCELERLGIPAAVAGGLALSTWKYVRATRDIDLLVSIDENAIERVLRQLRAAGLLPKRDPPSISLGQLDVIPLLYEPPDTYLDIQIDLLLAKSPYHREALRRRIPAEFPEFESPLAVLACEDLVLHKLLAARLIDRSDAAELLRINGDGLDMQYLTEWTKRLALQQEFAEVWTAAFPEKAFPDTD
jgi:hypothetical protein